MSRLYVRWSGYRSVLGPGIQRYLEAKRALGRRFANEERALRLLDRFLSDNGIAAIEDVGASVIDAFLRSRPRASGRGYNHLLGIVRRLLDWLAVQGVSGVVLYRAHPRRETGRRIPVIFTDAQVRQFLRGTVGLQDGTRAPLRAPTYRMIFATLYSLGLRVGEVSRLEVGDADLERGLLSVRRTKFGKDRLVPFGPRVAESLRLYLESRREAGHSALPDTPLFTFNGRSPVSTNSIRRVFQYLIRQAGSPVSASGSPPRVHDFRHTFAVSTLLNWYRSNAQPGDRLHHLSTFLGHVNIRATAVYLTITSELLEEANRRFATLASATIAGGV